MGESIAPPEITQRPVEALLTKPTAERSLPQSQFMEIADKLKILMTPEYRKRVILPQV